VTKKICLNFKKWSLAFVKRLLDKIDTSGSAECRPQNRQWSTSHVEIVWKSLHWPTKMRQQHRLFTPDCEKNSMRAKVGHI